MHIRILTDVMSTLMGIQIVQRKSSSQRSQTSLHQHTKSASSCSCKFPLRHTLYLCH
ncbi:unnamed protein product [Brassica oleracea]|uniref:(rape) hypothetical protein n=1 Tax=Brassica napus TaxID=3708 RepID=A0A816KBD1_BRANA|nr:unnamed protein product [Brassica napus]